MHWVDGLLAVLLCALAFLLASTPARNSDLWLHLASGRAIVRGETPWGSDPFSSTTEGVYWVNSTWLSDVVLFALRQGSDGKALVPAKAVLVTLIAGLLLLFRLRGSSNVLLFFLGSAALLASAPWLALQPVLLSLLGVLLTLYLMERPQLVEASRAARARKQRWLVLPLFALWANLDGWFVLGPLVVGLYALGEAMRGGGADRRSEFSPLAWLTLAGFVACLCTPYHYRTFAWPTPLGITPAERAWRHDPLGRDLVVSPFGARFVASPIFASPGAWAYYLLAIVGAGSFLSSVRTLRPGRLLVWLALAALSIYQARTIPFFAVAGTALLALNLQDGMAARQSSEMSLRLRNAARASGLIAGLALVVLAWPGWLQPAPYRPRGWTLKPDGSLVRMAHHLQRLHAEKCFPPDRFALTFSPEVAHYLAWFCPAEKGFVDARWPLFNRVAEDFVRMRRVLLQGDSVVVERHLSPLLEAHRLDRIVLYDPDRDRIARAYRPLYLATNEWELLAVEGGAALFARRSGSIPSSEVFDYSRAAYHPAADKRALSAAPPSPQPSPWFDAFRLRADDRSPDREEAALHLLSFDLQTEMLAKQWLATQATGLIGCGLTMDPANIALTLALRLDFTLPPSPRAPLLLAVRAARRALGDHPDDAQAFLLLGEAYVRLARHTRETQWQTRLPRFAALRHVQTLTALEQAVLLRPDLDKAHAILAQLYMESEQWDRVLDHLQARLRIAERAAKRGQSAAPSAALRADVEQMRELVEQAEKIYQANSADKTDPSKVLSRATLAARYRLTRKALEMLLASYPAIFGTDGVKMQLDLMLKAGRAYEIRAWLTPEHEREIGFSRYHWIQAQAAAACGDYAAADAELEKGSQVLQSVAFLPKIFLPPRSDLAFRGVGTILALRLPLEGVAGLATGIYFQTEALRPVGQHADLLRQEADARVVRGLLALEWGDVESARRLFRAALDVWGSEEMVAMGGGLDFSARPIAQQQLQRFEPRP